MLDIENSELERELVDLKLQNKEMATELGFKKEKIDKLEDSLKAIEGKLDKLIERSEERDNINEKRLVALETSQSNIRTFITIGFSLLSIIIAALGVMISFVHW